MSIKSRCIGQRGEREEESKKKKKQGGGRRLNFEVCGKAKADTFTSSPRPC